MKRASVVRTRILPGLAAVVVVGALAALAWQGYTAVMSQPFQRVVFTGNAGKLAPEDVAALEQAVMGMSSIGDVRDAARRLPWVRDVSVRREYPHAVEVAFETHDVVARWGDRALVSSRGAVFHAPFVGTLPRFLGADNAGPQMAAEYPAIARTVAALGANVAELRLSPRGGWHVVLDSGLELELGRGDIHARLARFAAAWPALAAQGVETRFADLRHATGFAIRSTHIPGTK